MRVVATKPFKLKGQTIDIGTVIDVPAEALPNLVGYAKPMGTGDECQRTPPSPRTWLTEKGELRASGYIPDLEAEIVNLTVDNLLLQRQLLERHCEAFDRHHLGKRWEQWEGRVAVIEYDDGFNREKAELKAATEFNLLAYLAERNALRQ